MNTILILLFVIGIPLSYLCRWIANDGEWRAEYIRSERLSRPNWGWPQTVGYENPTGPIPTIAQILGLKKYP